MNHNDNIGYDSREHRDVRTPDYLKQPKTMERSFLLVAIDQQFYLRALVDSIFVSKNIFEEVFNKCSDRSMELYLLALLGNLKEPPTE